MSANDPRDENDALAGSFDQTNDMVGGLEGQSDGTAEGETASAGRRGVDNPDGRDLTEDATHIGSDLPGDDRGTA